MCDPKPNNRTCCVRNCFSKAGRERELSFHSFPKPNESKVRRKNNLGVEEIIDRRKAWEDAIKTNKVITDSMTVCSLHFKDEDFFPDVLYLEKKRRVLLKIAVPSLHLPATRSDRRLSSARKPRNLCTVDDPCIVKEEIEIKDELLEVPSEEISEDDSKEWKVDSEAPVVTKDGECTPPEIEIGSEMNELLPAKSRQVYEKQYARFENWRKECKIFTISEDILLAYFELLRQKYKSSSLWCLYSQLRSCFSIYMKVDISVYHKLQVFLKRCSEGYAPKKSNILEESEINKFISEADDRTYMAMKVILIMGYSGACRREELTYMSTDDIKYEQDSITVSILKTKNNLSRQFVISEEIWVNLIRNYAALRPKNITHKRFFLTYRKGRCVNNPIGINTMGKVSKEIATFLKLPQPELYTGHCFRRSSATQLANCGGDLLTLKRHGGGKSSSVAKGDVEATLKKKIGMAQMLKPQHADLKPSCSSVSEPHTELNLPSSSFSEPDSRTNTTAIGNSKIQQYIVTIDII